VALAHGGDGTGPRQGGTGPRRGWHWPAMGVGQVWNDAIFAGRDGVIAAVRGTYLHRRVLAEIAAHTRSLHAHTHTRTHTHTHTHRRARANTRTYTLTRAFSKVR
jgi:hypothetical protein